MPEVAVPAVVLQPRTTSDPTSPDNVTENDIAPPSPADAAPTDTVTIPESVIVVVAEFDAALTAAVPFAVEAPVNVTISVSPWSRKSSGFVAIAIVPDAWPDAIVRLSDGAV